VSVSAAAPSLTPDALPAASTAAFHPTVMDMSLFGASIESGCDGASQWSSHSPSAPVR
jgi:hypothetical protein